jgi:hypothetical protein
MRTHPPLRQALADYLALRRTLGSKLPARPGPGPGRTPRMAASFAMGHFLRADSASPCHHSHTSHRDRPPPHPAPPPRAPVPASSTLSWTGS